MTLRRREDSGPIEALSDNGANGAIDRARFAERFGADPADIERVEEFAAAHELDVVQANAARRAVVLSGTIAEMSAAFGVHLEIYEHPLLGTFRGRTGAVRVPAAIGDVVESVLGLDDRPVAVPHFRRLRSTEGAIAPHATRQSYTPTEVARLYDFPTSGNGSGQTVAIIELGGGSRQSDLRTYFSEIGVTPQPRVVSVSVDGATNKPDGPNGADGEVMLDIEVVGAVAPGARIVVYFAPNTTRGFLDAITTATHDTRRKPSVISISWGMAEDNWTAQALQAYDNAFQDAAALGVTVCCASGDDGSADNISDGHAHVDFPASSPFVLACGGTRLESHGGAISDEITWHEQTGGATGGGVSRFFALPAYQAHAGVPHHADDAAKTGRGVPDVSGDADPSTGYRVRVDGQEMVIGGTSAVAPLYAALIALLNEARPHPVGFANPVLYANGAANGAFREIISGGNGAYSAGPGWDACTGLGSPHGNKLKTLLSH